MVRTQLTPQQRAYIDAEFYRNNNNVYRVIQRFREVYPNARCMSFSWNSLRRQCAEICHHWNQLI